MLKVLDKIRKNKSLIFIIVFSFTLRVFFISKLPPSLNWDEVSHGYNAYSILKTGKDEWGESFPSIFRAYGDYKLPVYIYLTALSEFFFGLNAFAVRLPSVLAGVGTVILTYFLVFELFSKSRNKVLLAQHRILALAASFLVAVEPWSLFLSRGAFEANLALFFFVAGVYFFLIGISHAFFNILFSTIFFGLSVWTYNSYRIFTPLMLLVLVVLHKEKLLRVLENNKFIIINSVFVIIFFFAPMFGQLSGEVGQARYGKVAIIDEGAINKIIELRNQKNYPEIIERFIYNRPVFFIKKAAVNWSRYFTGDFIFVKGGNQYQYNVQNHGLLYLANIPIFIIGIVLLIKLAIAKDRSALLLIVWILLAPIPASITRDSPHTLRAVTFLPIPMVISAIGFIAMISKAKANFRNVLILTYIIVIAVFMIRYLFLYSGEYRKNYSWSWQYGYEEVVNYAKKYYGKYDKIIFTKKYGEPHIFVLFYWPWDPASYRSDPNLIRYKQSDWYWVDRFDKFYFVNDWDIPEQSDMNFVLESGEEFDCDQKKCLLVTSPGNVHQDWKLLETVYFLDRRPSFEIYEN